MLYQAYQAQLDLSTPMTAVAELSKRWMDRLPRAWSASPPVRYMVAGYEMLGRARLTHERPAFGITAVEVDGRMQPVREELVMSRPFASLLRFSTETAVTETAVTDQAVIDKAVSDKAATDGEAGRPKVLLVAALAGHFSTLLRDTVRTLVRDHDVYITDWHNARDVPVGEGHFGLDEYIDHVIGFLEHLGPGAHVLAVCQPCPAALAATALMAASGHPAQPRSLTLMAGPVDPRINPTQVNDLAHSQPLSWFERNFVTTVPSRYPGAGRRVYPGFLQLSAFAGMNAARHWSQQLRLYDHLVHGRGDEADAIKDFYDEYFAVLDMTAEFYLETVDSVFQKALLARGEMVWRGRPVDPSAIANTALLTIEGERDDICGAGQTSAAHDLCSGIAPGRKAHHLQQGAGHYGVFAGSRWQEEIYPIVRSFIQANDG